MLGIHPNYILVFYSSVTPIALLHDSHSTVALVPRKTLIGLIYPKSFFESYTCAMLLFVIVLIYSLLLLLSVLVWMVELVCSAWFLLIQISWTYLNSQPCSTYAYLLLEPFLFSILLLISRVLQPFSFFSCFRLEKVNVVSSCVNAKSWYFSTGANDLSSILLLISRVIQPFSFFSCFRLRKVNVISSCVYPKLWYFSKGANDSSLLQKPFPTLSQIAEHDHLHLTPIQFFLIMLSVLLTSFSVYQWDVDYCWLFLSCDTSERWRVSLHQRIETFLWAHLQTPLLKRVC